MTMRACVLGQGSIGRRHAAHLLDVGLRVAAYDPVRAPAPGVEACASEAAALAGADVCVVASPSSEHERHARLALEAGVPVLVEKPLALDAAAGERLERLAARARRAARGGDEPPLPPGRQRRSRAAAEGR